jgi:MFS family permease
MSLFASILFASSYSLAGRAFANHFPLWTFIVAFFLIGTATSALYFSALTTSAKNFAGHRGLSIAAPIAAFGLSSFWEALVAGSPLFSKKVQAGSGDVTKELDVVKLFNFFAVLLGIVGVIGSLGLIVIPSHLPKRVEGEEEGSEEDALLPRATESETSSVISLVSAREELSAEHRPFLTEKSTYLFGMALLVLLGSGEMFINCVRPPHLNLINSWEQCCRPFVLKATLLLLLIPLAIYPRLLFLVPFLASHQA